jgi:hypothetical protein
MLQRDGQASDKIVMIFDVSAKKVRKNLSHGFQEPDSIQSHMAIQPEIDIRLAAQFQTPWVLKTKIFF